MFRTYINKEDLYREKFAGDIYISGDLAFKDEDGYFWYVSRSDDVINTAGHLVGPFEVESALLEIEEVVDVAVIGVPDPILHEKIIAFLCLRKDCAWSRALELKCRVNISIKYPPPPPRRNITSWIRSPRIKAEDIEARVESLVRGQRPGDLSTMEE
jgi:acetyl-CoA synthetase